MALQHRILPIENKEGESILKDKSIDLCIYEMLQNKSYKTDDGIRFCYKKGLTQQSLYDEYCDNCSNSGSTPVSFGTFKKNYKNLFTKQMVTEGEVSTKNGEQFVKAFILAQDYKIYQLVPLDTMRFLVNATNSNVIKIYGYLLNKSKGFIDYKFTLMELATEALGLSKTTNDVEKKAEDCLNILTLAGLVKYENIYELNQDNRPVPRKVLKEVKIQYQAIEQKIKENVIEKTFNF